MPLHCTALHGKPQHSMQRHNLATARCSKPRQSMPRCAIAEPCHCMLCQPSKVRQATSSHGTARYITTMHYTVLQATPQPCQYMVRNALGTARYNHTTAWYVTAQHSTLRQATTMPLHGTQHHNHVTSQNAKPWNVAAQQYLARLWGHHLPLQQPKHYDEPPASSLFLLVCRLDMKNHDGL